MADRLVDLILKNIDKDKLLQVQYERLLVEYTANRLNEEQRFKANKRIIREYSC